MQKYIDHRFLYIQARSNVPNSTPQFEVAGSIEYIDGHDAGFYFIGYSECRVPCKLAFIQLTLKGAGVFYCVKVQGGAKNAPPLDQLKNGVKLFL